MSFKIKQATRSGITPLIALYSESGCGKTFSSLLMARGIAGPNGKIIMIDSEGGRGELYADVDIIRGYEVIPFEAPFSPARYIEAITLAQDKGADVIITDSGTHEWEGIGGVLDMAATKEETSGKPGLHNWKTPKFEHAKFIQALMRAKVPIIVCLRAKHKTRQVKVDIPPKTASMAGGFKPKKKTEIIRDEHTSPIQSEEFIFEATCHGEIMTNHKLRLTKWSHPQLKSCFPVNAPITIETGELIQKWCKTPGKVPRGTPPVKEEQPPADDKAKNEGTDTLKTLKTQLWNATKSIHLGESSALEGWLKEKFILTEDEKLSTLTAERLEIIIDLALMAKAEQEGVE